MNPIEYLEAAKQAMGITSDNELAKRLEANRGTISAIREGKRGVPVEMAFRLAITLNQDPATVLADLESQRATTPEAGRVLAVFSVACRYGGAPGVHAGVEFYRHFRERSRSDWWAGRR